MLWLILLITTNNVSQKGNLKNPFPLDFSSANISLKDVVKNHIFFYFRRPISHACAISNH